MALESDGWRDLREGHERLTWARIAWQTRASAVRGSAKDAAQSMGMVPNTYRAYERAPGSSKHIPLDHQAAIRFGRKFGVSWRWLLLAEGSPEDDQLPEAQQRVLRAFERVDTAQQEALADLVEQAVGLKRVGSAR